MRKNKVRFMVLLCFLLVGACGYAAETTEGICMINYEIIDTVLTVFLVLGLFVAIMNYHIVIIKRRISSSYKKEILELKHMSTIMEALPMGVAIYDKDGKQTYINSTLAEMFGVDNVGKHIARGISIYEDPVIPRSIANDIKEGNDVDCCITYDINLASKMTYFTSNLDKTLYLDSKVRFLKNDNGELESIVLLIHDITKMLEKEKVTENQRDQLQLAISARSLSVWEYVPEDNTATQLYTENLDYKPEKMSFPDFLNTIHPDDLSIFLSAWDKVIDLDEKSVNCVIRRYNIKSKRQEYYSMEMKGSYKANGNLEKVIGVNRNINDDIVREEEKNKAFSALSLVLNRPGQSVYSFDLDNFAFSHFEDSHFVKMDITMPQLVRHIHPDDIKLLRKMFVISTSDDMTKQMFVARIKKDLSQKEYNYYEIFFSILRDKEDNPISLLMSMHNVTDLKSTINRQKEILDALQIALDAGRTRPWIYNTETGTYRVFDKSDMLYLTSDVRVNNNKFYAPDFEKVKGLIGDLKAKKVTHGTRILKIWNDKLQDYIVTEQSLKGVPDKDGKVTMIIGASKDLSDLLYLKKELEERVKMLNMIYDNISTDICLYDKDAILCESNYHCVRELGLDEEVGRQAIGKLNLMNDKNLSEDEKQMLRNGYSFHKIMEYKSCLAPQESGIADSEKKYVIDCNFLVLHDDAENVSGYMVIGTNITNLVNEKEEVEQLKAKYEQMIKEQSETKN